MSPYDTSESAFQWLRQASKWCEKGAMSMQKQFCVSIKRSLSQNRKRSAICTISINCGTTKT